MGSTFLNLTNRVLRRINEVPLTAANFADATGIHATAKDAVNSSIRSINQEEFQWPFNYSAGSQTLTGLPSPVQTYALPTDYKVIDWDSFFLQRDASLSIEGRHLRFIEYDEWVALHRSADEEAVANMDTGDSYIPSMVFKTPDDKFGVSPPPSDAFVVKYNSWVSPAELSADSDTTDVPSRFDNVIEEGALIKLDLFRDNYEGKREAEKSFTMGIKNMRSQLINTYKHAFDLRTGNAVRRGY